MYWGTLTIYLGQASWERLELCSSSPLRGKVLEKIIRTREYSLQIPQYLWLDWRECLLWSYTVNLDVLPQCCVILATLRTLILIHTFAVLNNYARCTVAHIYVRCTYLVAKELTHYMWSEFCTSSILYRLII